MMGNWNLWSIYQILGVFCPYISKNGQKTAVLNDFFSAFLSISTHILCLLARFLVFFCAKSIRNLLYDLLTPFLWSWNAKFFVFWAWKPWKRLKILKKPKKSAIWPFIWPWNGKIQLFLTIFEKLLHMFEKMWTNVKMVNFEFSVKMGLGYQVPSR